MKKLLEEANTILPEIIADRRAIHQNPEVGLYLPQTVQYIAQRLDEMKISYQHVEVSLDEETRAKYRSIGFGDAPAATGILAQIGEGSPCILLRADTDALPMSEENNLPFRATGDKAHMCGHDAHTAMLLHAAALVKSRENELEGSVKFLFQPGEEWGIGAKFMLDGGILEDPKVDMAMGLHIMSTVEAGQVTYASGVASASMDTYMIKILGSGGHSSQPHLTVDPLNIMNQLYSAFSMLASREVNPAKTVALTCGVAKGGTAVNIIPDTAQLEVAFRAFDPETRDHLCKRIPEITDYYCKAWKAEYRTKDFHTPSTYADPAVCDCLVPIMEELVGATNVTLVEPMTGTEDFGYISEAVPSAYFILGAGGADAHPHHNPKMQLDESVFAIGAAMYAACGLYWKKKGMQ